MAITNKENQFLTILSESIQTLCNGFLDFESELEIVGYMNISFDKKRKVDVVLNERVKKEAHDSITDGSNSYLAKKGTLENTKNSEYSIKVTVPKCSDIFRKFSLTGKTESQQDKDEFKASIDDCVYTVEIDGDDDTTNADSDKTNKTLMVVNDGVEEGTSSSKSEKYQIFVSEELSVKDEDKSVTNNKDTATTSQKLLLLPKRKYCKHDDVSLQNNKCECCGFTFKTKFGLQKHKKALLNKSSLLFVCEQCGRACSHQYALDKHMKSHTEKKEKSEEDNKKPEKNKTCDCCGITFKTYSSLLKHKNDLRNIITKRFVCTICGKVCRHKYTFDIHSRSHTGERPYQCDTCGKSYGQASLLKVHKRSHTGERPYKCKVCGKGFKAPSARNVHQQRHTGEKPYTCDICGKGFARKFDMGVHKRIHTGEKPYKCDVCGKCTTTSGELTLHARNHLPEKPFKCNICGASYKRPFQLKRHLENHTKAFSPADTENKERREKLYKCVVCGKSSTSPANLRRHQLRVHKELMEATYSATDSRSGYICLVKDDPN